MSTLTGNPIEIPASKTLKKGSLAPAGDRTVKSRIGVGTLPLNVLITSKPVCESVHAVVGIRITRGRDRHMIRPSVLQRTQIQAELLEPAAY